MNKEMNFDDFNDVSSGLISFIDAFLRKTTIVRCVFYPLMRFNAIWRIIS